MKLRSKLLALMLVTSSFSGAYADGCGGGGHGRFSFGGGFGGGGLSIGPFQSGHQYRQYSTPQYSMPTSYESTPQVIYQQPAHSIPSSSTSGPYQGQVIQGQPVMQGQPIVQGLPVSQGQPMSPGQPMSQGQPMNPGQPVGQSQTMIQGQPGQMQPGQMQPQQGAQFAGQPGSSAGVPGQATNYQNNMSQAMPNNGMNMQSQMQPTLAPPMPGSQPNMQNRPAQPSGQLISTGSNGSGLSALQILGSMSSGTVDARPAVESAAAGFQTATQMPPSHFGTWIVNMNGNQMIKLSLNQNNTFVWSVIKEGKESRLEGQYRLDGERLVLVRSSDLQQMAGSWTGNGSNFVFKLDGASDGGLPFARAQ